MMIEPNGTALDTMEALQNWVDRFQGMWDFADSFYGSLNFLEAEALADLLAVAHRPDLAALLMQGVCRATALPPCPLPHTALHFRTSGKERIMNTPDEIVSEVLEDTYGGGTRYAEPNRWDEVGLTLALARGDVDESAVRELILRAIEIDRAQRPFINLEAFVTEYEAYDGNDVGGFICAWQDGTWIDDRIAELARMWGESTGDSASDYSLSEDDWRAGLDDSEAAEITRLIEWRDNA